MSSFNTLFVSRQASISDFSIPLDFVLSRFAKEDEKSLNESFENAVAAIDCAIRQDLDLAMNRYNVK